MLPCRAGSNFIITPLAQVYQFVGLTELYYAGSHGMDIIGPVRQSESDNHPNCIRSTDKRVLGLKFVTCFMKAFSHFPISFLS